MTMLLAIICSALLLSDEPSRPQAAPSALEMVTAMEQVMADAIAAAEPSVVAIHREKGPANSGTLAVRGRGRGRGGVDGRVRSESDIRPGGVVPKLTLDPITSDLISFDFGSGVVIGDEGQILTAFHVVKNAARLMVRAENRQEFEAEIIAADPRSDLAVIAPMAIPGVPAPKLKPITIGDAGPLRKGSFLIALGNPFNSARDGKPSASWGILSNRARWILPEGDEMSLTPRKMGFSNYPTLLQLDSKLSLGMSGGAVVNLKGELVGLTTTASSPAGFDAMAGYAIPIDRLSRRAIKALKQGKEIEYGLLGVRPQLNSTNRVEEVSPNSPADQGQLQANDEIIAVDDTPIANFDDLLLAINSYAPGDEIHLTIRRQGKELNKTLVLAKYPVDPEMIATNQPPPWRGIRVDYLTTVSARPLGAPFENDRERLGGVVVSDVEPGSPAERAGLKKSVIIHKVDDADVTNPERFQEAVAKRKGPVVLTTDQGNRTIPES